MTKEKTNMVLPGEFITTEEEFASGKNTYEDKGVIKASIMGSIDFDQQRKEAKVKGKSIPVLKEGDIIIGRVVKVNEKMAHINIMGSAGEQRAITLSTGQIPVRNASQSFTEDMRNCFRLGDFVKAKVVMASRLAIDLATNETGLGVVEAHCKNCRSKMDFNKEKMTCLNCGSVEDRKCAEAVDVRTERPRDGSGSRGGFGGRSSGGFRGRDSGRSFGARSSGPRGGFGDRPRPSGGRDSRGPGSFGGNDRGHTNSRSSGPRDNFNRNDSRGRGGFRK